MISYKLNLEDIDWSKFLDLHEKLEMLERFIENREFDKIQSTFQNSYKVITTSDEKKLIGSCKIISDNIWYGAIFYVAVLPEYYIEPCMKVYKII